MRTEAEALLANKVSPLTATWAATIGGVRLTVGVRSPLAFRLPEPRTGDWLNAPPEPVGIEFEEREFVWHPPMEYEDALGPSAGRGDLDAFRAHHRRPGSHDRETVKRACAGLSPEAALGSERL